MQNAHRRIYRRLRDPVSFLAISLLAIAAAAASAFLSGCGEGDRALAPASPIAVPAASGAVPAADRSLTHRAYAAQEVAQTPAWLVPPHDDSPNGPKAWIENGYLTWEPRSGQVGHDCYWEISDSDGLVAYGFHREVISGGYNDIGLREIYHIDTYISRRQNARIRCSELDHKGNLMWSWWNHVTRRITTTPGVPQPTITVVNPGVAGASARSRQPDGLTDWAWWGFWKEPATPSEVNGCWDCFAEVGSGLLPLHRQGQEAVACLNSMTKEGLIGIRPDDLPPDCQEVAVSQIGDLPSWKVRDNFPPPGWHKTFRDHSMGHGHVTLNPDGWADVFSPGARAECMGGRIERQSDSHIRLHPDDEETTYACSADRAYPIEVVFEHP